MIASVHVRCLSLVVAASVAFSAFAQPAVSIVKSAGGSPVAPGQALTMTVATNAAGVTYRWMLNGNPISGATGTSYSMPAVGAADRGSYHVVVTDSTGSTDVDLGMLTVAQSDARLMNLSARAMAGMGANVLITGFVSRGDSNSTDKSMLVRAMGPSLGGMGGMMNNVLSNPTLAVFDGASRMMASDMGWMNAPVSATGTGTSTVQATLMGATMTMMNSVGAFLPTTGSADSALMMSAPPGAYTAIVGGAGNTSGIALAECYDADAAVGNGTNSARLVNMSARANVGTGSNVLIAGFVVVAGPSGDSATVMIRAMGPSLSVINVAGGLAHPMLTLYDSQSKPIATNTGWTSMPSMATGTGASPVHAGVESASLDMMSQLGAFPPMAGSADSALIATLPPGAYTAIVSGADSPMGGIALVEVYEIR